MNSMVFLEGFCLIMLCLGFFFFSLQVFCLYIMVCDFVFLWDLSVGVYVLCFLCFISGSFFLFVIVLFYFCFVAHFVLRKRKKRYSCVGMGRWGGSGMT